MTDSKLSEKRAYIWRHNSYLGWVVQMRQHLNSLVESPSTTEASKHYANSMLGLVPKLQNSLSRRVDQKD